MANHKKILFCVLNWGLGHASRSIPLIRLLLKKNTKLTLAADGRAGLLLQKEFPQLDYIELPAYNIQYSGNFMLSMGLQLPKILRAIQQEKHFINEWVDREKPDYIFSDNRYGCYQKNCVSIFITHQLNIRLPLPGAGFFASKSIQYLIRNFNQCWVPDYPEVPNLAGELAHGKNAKDVKYIGPLSRMAAVETPILYDAVAVLSGPEPERSRLEKILREQMKNSPGKFALVCGLTDDDSKVTQENNLTIFPYLLSKPLNELMLSAKVVICRSGYSSLMDLAQLSKKAILIPTPGQTEQEYLADSLFAKKLFFKMAQKGFNLQQALLSYADYSGFTDQYEDNDLLLKNVHELL